MNSVNRSLTNVFAPKDMIESSGKTHYTQRLMSQKLNCLKSAFLKKKK